MVGNQSKYTPRIKSGKRPGHSSASPNRELAYAFDTAYQAACVCWQPAKVAHFETREIMGWMEVW